MPDPAPLPPDAIHSMSGLEIMQALLEGRLPRAPIAELIGMRLTDVAAGRAVFTAVPGPGHYNPLGSVHGGFAATLLDSCMGCAVHTTLPVGTTYTTLELKVSYVRGMSANTGEVRAEGIVLNSGRRVAFAEGRLLDAAGKLLGHATTTCLIFPPSA